MMYSSYSQKEVDRAHSQKGDAIEKRPNPKKVKKGPKRPKQEYEIKSARFRVGDPVRRVNSKPFKDTPYRSYIVSETMANGRWIQLDFKTPWHNANKFVQDGRNVVDVAEELRQKEKDATQ